MIPTSAVRETLILILFGIILVPIAAKRAQDARGYWQTFQLQDLATTLPSDHAVPLALAAPIIQNKDNNNNYHHNNNAMAIAQNETSLPAVPAAAAVYATSSAPRAETARTGLTIRFGSATSAGGSEAIATIAPKLPQERQQHQHQPQPQKQQQQKQPVQQSKTAELPAATKMSDASKGRWTLIWMGSAIAAVAVFMSLC